MRHFIGAAIGAAANIAGSIMQNKQMNKQLEAQKEENEKSRAFNRSMAEWQNEQSIAQWNRENSYNSPAAQMARLKAAGLNPDLMYQGGAGNLSASSSPEMASVAPGMPTDMSAMSRYQSVGEVLNNTLNSSLVQAQIDKAKSETRNTNSRTDNLKIEGKILSADALTRAAQNEQSLEIGKSQIYVNHSIARLNHSEQEHISAKITNLSAATDNLYAEKDKILAQIKNVNMSTASQRFGMFMRSKEFNLAVKQYVQSVKESNSRINLNFQQARDILVTQSARLLNLNTGSLVNYSTYDLNSAKTEGVLRGFPQIDIGNEQASFNLDSDKTYKNTERTVGIATDIIDSLSGLIQAFGSFMGGMSKLPTGGTPIKGFR